MSINSVKEDLLVKEVQGILMIFYIYPFNFLKNTNDLLNSFAPVIESGEAV
jgi:hypothetical protein